MISALSSISDICVIIVQLQSAHFNFAQDDWAGQVCTQGLSPGDDVAAVLSQHASHVGVTQGASVGCQTHRIPSVLGNYCPACYSIWRIRVIKGQHVLSWLPSFCSVQMLHCIALSFLGNPRANLRPRHCQPNTHGYYQYYFKISDIA